MSKVVSCSFKVQSLYHLKGALMYRIRKTWKDAKSQLGAYESLQNAKSACPSGYSVYDDNGNVIYSPSISISSVGFQAKQLNGLSETDKIKKIAPLYQEVMKKTGMLASVGLAQFCLESGYGTTDLAQEANNLHGMKCSLSGNTWTNSTWDGTSKYGKYSPEVYNGVTQSVYSEFRRYKCCEDSIADRASYFIGAKNGSVLRYPDINKIKDAKKQVELIKKGGYATDPNYVSKLCNLIDRYNLTQYDNVQVQTNERKDEEQTSNKQEPNTQDTLYRVRESWSNEKSQKGAFSILANAQKCADENPGYSVFDSTGKCLYTSYKLPFQVRVSIDDLNIRTGPGTEYNIVRKIEPGVFTITEVKSGKGSTKGWGHLKSNVGWISLDYTSILS